MVTGDRRGDARRALYRFGWERAVRDDVRVHGALQEALFVMATFADPDGFLTVGLARVAECLNKSERTARRVVEEGRGLGYLDRVSRGHHIHGRAPTASVYRLCLPDPPAAVEDPATGPLAIGSEADTGDRLRVVAPGVAQDRGTA